MALLDSVHLVFPDVFHVPAADHIDHGSMAQGRWLLGGGCQQPTHGVLRHLHRIHGAIWRLQRLEGFPGRIRRLDLHNSDHFGVYASRLGSGEARPLLRLLYRRDDPVLVPHHCQLDA